MRTFALLFLGVVLGWVASGVDWSGEAAGQDGKLEFAAAAPDAAKAQAAQVEVYKALKRVEIEEIGGRKKTNGVSGFHDFSYLTAGLNSLANDGWYLVVIEPAHNYPISGSGNAQTIEASAYIFERR